MTGRTAWVVAALCALLLDCVFEVKSERACESFLKRAELTETPTRAATAESAANAARAAALGAWWGSCHGRAQSVRETQARALHASPTSR